MLITMFTDVSLHPASGLASYAIWAKVNGTTIRQARLFRQPIHDSNVAEVCGIINGLYFVINTIKPPAGSKILAQSDSETALSVLRGSNRNALFNGLPERRTAVLDGTGIVVEYRHVKGHKGARTPRNAVNTWCDHACRKVLREHQARLNEMLA